MDYKLLFGILITGLLLVGSVSAYYLYSHFSCENIDYEDKVFWDEMKSQGLFPIIDIKTKQPIIKPVGCEL